MTRLQGRGFDGSGGVGSAKEGESGGNTGLRGSRKAKGMDGAKFAEPCVGVVAANFERSLTGRAGLGWTDVRCATNVAQQPGSDPEPPGEKTGRPEGGKRREAAACIRDSDNWWGEKSGRAEGALEDTSGDEKPDLTVWSVSRKDADIAHHPCHRRCSTAKN